MPTEAEWDAERLSWVQAPINSTNTSAGAFASPLKLPVSGGRAERFGGPFNVGSDGIYWSSSVSGSNARHLYFSSSEAFLFTFDRAFGFAVRCLKD